MILKKSTKVLTHMKSDPFYKETDSRINPRLVFATTSVAMTYDPCHEPLLGVQWVPAQKWPPAIALKEMAETINISMLRRCY